MVEEYYVIENDISCEVENADRRGKPLTGEEAVEAGLKWLCNNEFRSLDFDGDARGMQQSIVNQAVLDRLSDAFQVLLVESARDFESNAKIVEARGVLGLASSNSHDCAFGSQIVLFQVLRSVKGSTGTQGGEEQLGRSHTFIETTIF